MQVRLPALVVLAHVLVVSPCLAQPTDGGSPATTVRSDTGQTASPRPNPTPIAAQALSANTWSVWVGGSFATGSIIGNVRRARMGVLGLQYERLLVPAPPAPQPDGLTLTYTADLFPVFLLSLPPGAVAIPPFNRTSSVQEQGLDTYGVGASPAGLRLTSRIAKRVQPFIAGSTGLAYFVRPVPSEWGKQLNFMFDVGAGVQVILTPEFLLTAGYRYHHLSNGFRGRINPGIDANLFYFGIAVSR